MEKFQPNIDLYPSSSVWNGCGSCPFCLNIKNSQFIFYEETKNIFFRNSKINFFFVFDFSLISSFSSFLTHYTTKKFYHKNFEIKNWFEIQIIFFYLSLFEYSLFINQRIFMNINQKTHFYFAQNFHFNKFPFSTPKKNKIFSLRNSEKK